MLDARSSLITSRRRSRLGAGLVLALLAATARGEDAKKPHTDFYGDSLPPGAVARLGTIRLRHYGADMVFSQDGKQMISCGTQGEVRVWDTATGKLRRRTRLAWKPREGPLGIVALSPDGATAAAWSDGTVHLYDTATGSERGRLPGSPSGHHLLMTYSPDSKRLVVQGRDARKQVIAQMWDVVAGKKCRVLGGSSAVELRAVAYTPDGKRLAGIENQSERIHVWDANTGAEIGKRNPRIANGWALAYSPDGTTLAVGTLAGREVHLLNAATLQEKERPLTIPASAPAGYIGGLIVFSPDGRWLAAGYGGGADVIHEYGFLLWDRKGSKEARRLPARFEGCFAFAPDSKTLAYNDRLGSEIRLIDTASGRQLSQRCGHDTTPHSLAVSPDGKTIASADSQTMLCLWDAVTGRWRSATARSADSQATLCLWEAGAGKLLRRLNGRDGATSVCLFAAEGRQLISAGQRGTFQVWNIADGKELRRFECFSPGDFVSYHAVHVSTDGKRLAAIVSMPDAKAPKAQQLVWDFATGERLRKVPYPVELRVWQGPGPFGGYRQMEAHAAFAPDGEMLTAWRGGRVRLEESATGCLRATLPRDVAAPLRFSLDGRLVAATILQRSEDFLEGDQRKGLALIETASGEEVVRLDTGAFAFVCFTTDSRALVVATKKTLQVWNPATGQRVQEMAWPESVHDADDSTTISSLAALPGGRVATGMREGDILIWDLGVSSGLDPKPLPDFTRKDLEGFWSDLAGEPAKAHRASHRLTGRPTQCVSYLGERLQPAALDGKRIEKWLADLDSAAFATREAASRELSRLHYCIEPRLRRALETNPSLELRWRVQAILAEPKRFPAEVLRTLRAIAVLERIGTPEARRILEKLSGGAASPETRAAQAALQRLKHRDAWTKETSSP